MIIARSGSGADHGVRQVELRNGYSHWDVESASIRFARTRVWNFSGHARHDYRVFISAAELAEVIKAAAEGLGTTSDAALRAALHPCLPDLLKLAHAASEPGGSSATTARAA